MNGTTQSVVIVGASGYAGAELIALLHSHPGVEVIGLFGSPTTPGAAPGPARTLAQVHPRFRGAPTLADLPIAPADIPAILDLAPDVVLLATPPTASHDLAPSLVDAGPVVIDLSAAFRFADPSVYPQVYGFTHQRPDLLDVACYGLAELNATQIAATRLVAVPGCYPTSVLLPLRPLVDAGLVEPGEPVLVSAVSGASGAGQGANPRTTFGEVSLQAYNVLAHRHGPEMQTHAGVPVLFTPQLGAFERGILSTLHIKLTPDADESIARQTLSDTYRDASMVHVLPAGQWPGVADVRGSNRCDIGLAATPGQPWLVVSSAIDNLIKGAAGQAVQCLNLVLGHPVDTGFGVAELVTC